MQPLQPVSGSDLQRFLSAPEELLQQSVGLQLAIASFHQTPASWLERYAVADNSGTPSVLRQQLAKIATGLSAQPLEFSWE